ncbi:MAG: FHA domain-containing protein [Chloroflexi bacterium]|nr:FHA domain-containing protein [Chloroflexota bacterium]
MDNVVITLRYSNTHEADLELPAGIPFTVLGALLAEKLNWPELEAAGKEFAFSARVVNSGLVIRPAETLARAGVVHGDILELILTPLQTTPVDETPPPTNPPRGAFLQSATTKAIFPLRGRTNLVGRASGSAVNLSSLPKGDAVSRTHANIMRRDDGFWIKDENSTNGTIVDDYLLEPGERVRIRDGSRIQFGEDGPVLFFFTGSSRQGD